MKNIQNTNDQSEYELPSRAATVREQYLVNRVTGMVNEEEFNAIYL